MFKILRNDQFWRLKIYNFQSIPQLDYNIQILSWKKKSFGVWLDKKVEWKKFREIYMQLKTVIKYCNTQEILQSEEIINF